MGNQMIFAKKGAVPPQGPPSAGPSAAGPLGGHKPELVITVGHHKANPGDASIQNVGDQGDGGGTDSTDAPVQCPNCGCQFDPTTGDILNAGDYSGDQSNADAEPPDTPSKKGPPDSGDEGDQ